MFTTLLDHIDLTGAVVTTDTLHTQRAHAHYLVESRSAHYVLTVKRNQPTLHSQLKALPCRTVPVGDNTHDRGHGRVEWRTLKVTAVAAGLGFPHAAQAIRIIRRRRPLNATKGTGGRPKPCTRSPRWTSPRPAPPTWPHPPRALND